MTCNRSIEARIAELARRQGGHVTRKQLFGLGLTRSWIANRLRTGYLIAVFNGVYAVGHIPTHPHDRAHGVLLAASPHAALSHTSAATLWGIRKDWEFPLHITVPTDRRLPRDKVVVHRNKLLTAADVRTHYGLTVTSPALTILDHAATKHVTDKRLERAIDDLRMPTRYVTLEQLEELTARYPRHRGTPRLRRVLGKAQPEPTRSSWEQEWPPFAARHGLPQYEMNVPVAGHRVDVLFPNERIAIEMDGWEAHRSYGSFVGDRDRDADLLAASGIVTVRLTRTNFARRPADEAHRLKQILRRRRASTAARPAA